MARSGKGVRSIDRGNSAPRNDPQKYSMEQAVSAGSQIMTLPLEIVQAVQVIRIIQSMYLD